jgi:ABC-type dipeptide/oligopeptide/nickel transport system ATPase component
MKQPLAFNQVIGNSVAIERIKREIADNNGLPGCVFFLQGETGNGKTMIANIIADLAKNDGADVHDEDKIDCNDDDTVAWYLDTIKSLATNPTFIGGYSVFIFNECDRLSVENVSRFKTTFDAIQKAKNAGKIPPVAIIFTTAKTIKTVNPSFQKHWHEFISRCAYCEVGVTRDELNEHFEKVTGGALTNVAFKIPELSVRYAWRYVKNNDYPIIDVMPEPESFVLPEAQVKARIEMVDVKIGTPAHGSLIGRQFQTAPSVRVVIAYRV